MAEANNSELMARNWYAEPLLHFLVLGAALFLLSAWWDRRSTDQGTIVVSEASVRALEENFRRTWQRPPTGPELEGLIDEHVRDEVLTREAQRLGLERDDAVIRRRLRQKIEIITEETAASIVPTDSELMDYLAKNAEAFHGESRVAFAQVYLDSAKRGQRIAADARNLLEKLGRQPQQLAQTELQAQGDRLFALKPRYELTSTREISAAFGSEFATDLVTRPVGKWSGPLQSGYGVHLVYVEQVEHAPAAELADVRPLVEREWRNVQRKRAAEAQYQKLLAGYRLVIKRRVGENVPARTERER